MIHPQPRQRDVGDGLCQPPVAFNQREIDHPPQEPPGNARRAARATGNLDHALGVGIDVRQARAARDDAGQFLGGVEMQPCRDAEAVAERRGQQPHPRRGTDQRKGLQLDAHGARGWPLADHKIQLEILERGIKHLFHGGVQAVDLVDEQHIARFQIGQDGGQIARPRQHRTRGHAKPHPQFARHDLRQRGLAKARGAMKQDMIHRLAPAARAFDEYAQIGPRFGLTDEIGQRLRTQSAVDIFGQGRRAQGWIGLCHIGHLWLSHAGHATPPIAWVPKA